MYFCTSELATCKLELIVSQFAIQWVEQHYLHFPVNGKPQRPVRPVEAACTLNIVFFLEIFYKSSELEFYLKPLIDILLIPAIAS